MKSIDDAWEIIESLNSEAHSMAWDKWILSDECEDGEEAEDLREEASIYQRELFDEMFNDLPKKEKALVLKFVKEDKDFRDQFECYGGV
jgi:hypothetical protein